MARPSSSAGRLRRWFRESVPISLVGGLGTVLGWVTYELIYLVNPIPEPWRPTSSWLLAFLIGVARQHALYRWLTVPYPTPYWRSLGRAYLFYAGIAVIGSALNGYFVLALEWHQRTAYFVTVLLTGLLTLTLLKRVVFVRLSSSARAEPFF